MDAKSRNTFVWQRPSFAFEWWWWWQCRTGNLLWPRKLFSPQTGRHKQWDGVFASITTLSATLLLTLQIRFTTFTRLMPVVAGWAPCLPSSQISDQDVVFVFKVTKCLSRVTTGNLISTTTWLKNRTNIVGEEDLIWRARHGFNAKVTIIPFVFFLVPWDFTFPHFYVPSSHDPQQFWSIFERSSAAAACGLIIVMLRKMRAATTAFSRLKGLDCFGGRNSSRYCSALIAIVTRTFEASINLQLRTAAAVVDLASPKIIGFRMGQNWSCLLDSKQLL